MSCADAKLAMLEPTASLPNERRTELDRHLAECPACRDTHAAVANVAERLSGWPGIVVDPARKSACVGRLVGVAGELRESAPRRPAQARWVVRFALVGLVAALALGLGPVGRGLYGPGAAIAWAFSSVDRWCAEGTVTPPLLIGPERPVCNHVRIWYQQPGSLRILVDDSPDGPLYELVRRDGHTAVSDPYSLVGHGLEHEAQQLDVDELFAVREWLAAKAIFRAPVVDLGLERFGDRTVRRIEITPTGGWLAGGGGHGPEPIMLRVDAETMLPLLLETTTHGSTIVLDFEYGTDFPVES